MTDKYTREQKIERLAELVPEMEYANLAIMLGFESGEEWVFSRLSVIEKAEEAVKDIESGLAFTKLYRALK